MVPSLSGPPALAGGTLVNVILGAGLSHLELHAASTSETTSGKAAFAGEPIRGGRRIDMSCTRRTPARAERVCLNVQRLINTSLELDLCLSSSAFRGSTTATLYDRQDVLRTKVTGFEHVDNIETVLKLLL
jgi:hypothetical protein